MKVPTSARLVPLVSGLAILLLVGSDLVARQHQSASATWITAWGSSQQALGTTAITNATVRMIAQVAIGGDAVRVRLDNAFGPSPVVIGSAYIGQRTQSAALATGSNRRLLFNGSARVSIPAGGTVVSTVNQWIRTRARFDAVLDFDSVVRDSLDGDLISPPFNCDGIHPTPRGYYEMGKSVRLDLFRGGPGPASRR